MMAVKLLIFLFSFSIFLYPAAAESNLFNGQDWLRFLPIMKISYVSGLYDASAFAKATLYRELGKNVREDFMNIPENISFKEAVEKLDVFYADINNIDIPVVYALRIIKMELDGKSNHEIMLYKDGLSEIINSTVP